MATQTTTTCAQCGVTFSHPKHEHPKFCSVECRATFDREHAPHVCPVCGRTFNDAKYTRVTYCSRACRAVARGGHGERPCAICGSIFVPRLTGQQQFCSPRCVKRGRKLEQIKAAATPGKTAVDQTGDAARS